MLIWTDFSLQFSQFTEPNVLPCFTEQILVKLKNPSYVNVGAQLHHYIKYKETVLKLVSATFEWTERSFMILSAQRRSSILLKKKNFWEKQTPIPSGRYWSLLRGPNGNQDY